MNRNGFTDGGKVASVLSGPGAASRSDGDGGCNLPEGGEAEFYFMARLNGTTPPRRPRSALRNKTQ